MNEFLKTIDEINACTDYIREHGLIEHGISCKNWDIANIVPRLTDGDILDMGSSGGSCILENSIKVGIKGKKIGIDIEYPSNSSKDGIEFMKENLMHTDFPDNSFDTICCLSVIEHEVNFDLLAKECSRLLRKGGKLFITFDYWPTKVNTDGLTLYGLKWNILDTMGAMYLIQVLGEAGLRLSGESDWTTQDAVISDSYCSPFAGISYTFGIFQFIKQ